MLLDESEALAFLQLYKGLIAQFHGEDPGDRDEWLEARNGMIQAISDGGDETLAVIADKEIRLAVKNAISGQFCFLKRYKDHCAFLHLDTNRFYAVRSLTTPVEQLADEFSVVQAVLLPFRGKIVCDGLMGAAGVYLGSNYTKEIRDSYWSAKREGSLIWGDESDSPQPKLNSEAAAAPSTKAPTKSQGQYLAFIYYYTKVNGQAPAEVDFQRYFEVSPPSVHQMIKRLESSGYINRTPGKGRSIELLISKTELPELM